MIVFDSMHVRSLQVKASVQSQTEKATSQTTGCSDDLTAALAPLNSALSSVTTKVDGLAAEFAKISQPLQAVAAATETIVANSQQITRMESTLEAIVQKLQELEEREKQGFAFLAIFEGMLADEHWENIKAASGKHWTTIKEHSGPFLNIEGRI